MRKLFYTLLFTGAGFASTAQLVNTGATIFIQPGAFVFSSGAVTNTSGTITNNGKLEVQGNFSNSGTYNTTTADDSLILSGTGQVTLNTGGNALTNLTINKTTAADVVKLAASATVNNRLDYLSGSFTTDPITNPGFTLIAPVTAAFNFAAGREIAGSVQRTGWASGIPYVFNQPNMQVSTAGGTPPTAFRVTMIPQASGGDPTLNEREVKRKFLLAATGGSGFTSDVRFAYQDAEATPTNTEANLVPWQLLTVPISEWNSYTNAVTRDVSANYVMTTAIPLTALANEWKLADPNYTFNVTAFLRGPWIGSAMSTNLQAAGVIPAGQPYNVTPFNYAGTETGTAPAGTTDWILVELRKPASGSGANADATTIIGRKAGYVKSDGTVINTNGTAMTFDITKQGSSFIAIRHRNHLSVLSKLIPSNQTGSFSNDFSTLANAYVNPSISNDPMQVLPASSPVKYGLWAGNAVKDGIINSGDVGSVKANANVVLTGYQGGDINLDNIVNSGDVGITKANANNAAQTHTSRSSNPDDNKDPKTHVPQ